MPMFANTFHVPKNDKHNVVDAQAHGHEDRLTQMETSLPAILIFNMYLMEIK